MVGKKALLTGLLAERNDRAAIAVVTDGDAHSFLETLEEVAPADRIAVVDSTSGLRSESSHDDRIRSVSSPGDLTGIGIAVSEFADRFAQRGLPARVGVDSLTTLSAYADGQQLYRFLDAISQATTDRSASFFATLHTESLEREVLSTIGPLFDARIELRETDRGTELRYRPRNGGSSEWVSFTGDGGHRGSRSGAEDSRRQVSSIGELIRAVESESLTLTVYNHGDVDLGPLRTRFERLNVTVETEETPTVPEGVAILHRGEEFLAADSVQSLATEISMDELAAGGDRTSPVFDFAEGSTVGARAVEKSLLIRASRIFEMLAYREGTGTVHAGFQRLSLFAEGEHVQRIYRNLARLGLEVHVYGVPDASVEMDGVAFHESDAGEIADSWFVVYEGPGNAGALVAEERDPGEFYGFWTYQRPVAAGTVEYLEATY